MDNFFSLSSPPLLQERGPGDEVKSPLPLGEGPGVGLSGGSGVGLIGGSGVR